MLQFAHLFGRGFGRSGRRLQLLLPALLLQVLGEPLALLALGVGPLPLAVVDELGGLLRIVAGLGENGLEIVHSTAREQEAAKTSVCKGRIPCVQSPTQSGSAVKKSIREQRYGFWTRKVVL